MRDSSQLAALSSSNSFQKQARQSSLSAYCQTHIEKNKNIHTSSLGIQNAAGLISVEAEIPWDTTKFMNITIAIVIDVFKVSSAMKSLEWNRLIHPTSLYGALKASNKNSPHMISTLIGPTSLFLILLIQLEKLHMTHIVATKKVVQIEAQYSSNLSTF